MRRSSLRTPRLDRVPPRVTGELFIGRGDVLEVLTGRDLVEHATARPVSAEVNGEAGGPEVSGGASGAVDVTPPVTPEAVDEQEAG